MHTSNPWLQLEFTDPVVAPCDQAAINRLSPSDRDNVFLDLYPEPFIGDPDADVYLLNGNPGYSDQDNCFSCPSVMSSFMADVYSHKDRSFFWNDGNRPVRATCPKTGRSIVHQGQVYWQRRLKELTEAVGHNPRLFELEFFPYHSKDFYGFMKEPLPSFDYTRSLVEDAMRKGKAIFILRHKAEWESAVPNLKTYHTFSLISPRSTYLTKNNMCREAWNALLEKC